jgi:hypothetical protein
MLKEVELIMEKYGLIWADKIPNKNSSWVKPFSEGTAQVSGSGFSMNIATAGNYGGKDAAIGIGHYFYMTKENLGNETFTKLSNLINTLPVNAEQRVIPTAEQFSSVGLGIWCRDTDGSERDITKHANIEISLSERSEDRLMLVYGCIMADRDINNNDTGQQVPFIYVDPQGPLNDGKKDGNITAKWWLRKT